MHRINVKTNTRTHAHYVCTLFGLQPTEFRVRWYIWLSMISCACVSVCSFHWTWVSSTAQVTPLWSLAFMHMKIQRHHINGIFLLYLLSNKNSICVLCLRFNCISSCLAWFLSLVYSLIVYLTEFKSIVRFFSSEISVHNWFDCMDHVCIRFEKENASLLIEQQQQQWVHLCTNVESRVNFKEQKPIFIYWCCWTNVNN